MEKVSVGNSDLHICPIVFGAWAIGGWMWGGRNDDDAIKAIHASIDRGISTIDTAPIYGFGHSELLVGEALEGTPRDKVEILTKFGLKWGENKGEFHFKSKMNDGKEVDIYKYAAKDSVIKEVEDSLRRLNTDYIDLLQIHWADSTTPAEETMEALQLLIDQGKIRAAGVCNYDATQMKEAEKTIQLASNQVPYSMVLRDIETDVVPYCLEHGTGLLAYSPLQRGLLTGKITDDYVFGEGDHRSSTKFFKQPHLQRINAFLDKIKPLAIEKGVSLAQLVIQWTLMQPAITAVLVGARNEKQALENSKAMELELAEEEVDLINKELALVEIE